MALSAQAPNESANTQEANAGQSIENGIANVSTLYDEKAERIHRAQYEAQCDQGDDKRDSDLCAQWKAADAARDAAWWAAWGTAASAISGLLVIIAIGLAYQANKIARDTAKRELRAYISVTPKGVYAIDEDGQTRLPLFIENHGQTPAFKLTVEHYFRIAPEPGENDVRQLQREIMADLPQSSEGFIAPRSGIHVYVAMPLNPTPDAMMEIHEEKLAIMHWGVVRYLDAFDVVRHTFFSHYHWGEELNDANSKRCRFGNDAT